MPKTNNPWSTVTAEMQEKIAACDLEAIHELQNKGVDIHTRLWPEPFCGNMDAPIYLLNGNPGGVYSPLEEKLTADPLFCELMVANLNHQVVEGYDEFVFFNNLKMVNDKLICDKDETDYNKLLVGCEWWQKRTKELREVMEHIHPLLFNIEYFPYNSKNISDWRGKELPSFQYTNELVKSAIEKGKTIIIMRMKKEWLKRIPDLNDYANVYELSSAQSVYITKNNILPLNAHKSPESKDKAWSDLISL